MTRGWRPPHGRDQGCEDRQNHLSNGPRARKSIAAACRLPAACPTHGSGGHGQAQNRQPGYRAYQCSFGSHVSQGHDRHSEPGHCLLFLLDGGDLSRVKGLLMAYGITDVLEVDTFLALAREASTPGWWHNYGDVLPPWFRAFPGLEDCGRRACWYPGVAPGRRPVPRPAGCGKAGQAASGLQMPIWAGAMRVGRPGLGVREAGTGLGLAVAVPSRSMTTRRRARPASA